MKGFIKRRSYVADFFLLDCRFIHYVVGRFLESVRLFDSCCVSITDSNWGNSVRIITRSAAKPNGESSQALYELCRTHQTSSESLSVLWLKSFLKLKIAKRSKTELRVISLFLVYIWLFYFGLWSRIAIANCNKMYWLAEPIAAKNELK